MTTTDIKTLYGGRFLNGLANGCFMTFAQLYIQEGSPAKYRGLFLTGFQFSVSLVCAFFPSDSFDFFDVGVLLEGNWTTRRVREIY